LLIVVVTASDVVQLPSVSGAAGHELPVTDELVENCT
jgi:hypothetical protein